MMEIALEDIENNAWEWNPEAQWYLWIGYLRGANKFEEARELENMWLSTLKPSTGE